MMIERIWKLSLAISIVATFFLGLVSIFLLCLSIATGRLTREDEYYVEEGIPYQIFLVVLEVIGPILVISLIVGLIFLALSNNQQGHSLKKFLSSLSKSKTDKWLFGVCGGLGEHSPIPSWVWRFLFLLFLIWLGISFVTYILLATCMPRKKPT